MSNTLKSLRALSDPTRLRIMALLQKDELSVNELQEITGMGQSRISTHLGLLQEAELVQSRREGKRTFYKYNEQPDETAREFTSLAVRGAQELADYASDSHNLKRILEKRTDREKLYFNQIAGRFDRSYGPGRSWEAFGQMLLRILPPLVIADLGSGEGLLSELLARRAKKVIAIDNSEKIIAFAAAKAKKNGLKNLEFRLGDLSDPPLEAQSVDLVILSQALHHAKDPAATLSSLHKVVKPGGHIMILDLQQHQFQNARDLYGDRWLGFTEGELHLWLQSAGFKQIEVSIVATEEEPPHFKTILAAGTRV